MTELVQQSIPGTDVPDEPVKKRRGRPKGSSTSNKAGTVFSDAQGDFRVYVVEDSGQLTPASGSGGYTERKQAMRWLRQNGGSSDLIGRTIIVMHAISVVRISLQPSLQLKPRIKVARPAMPQAATQQPEPQTVTA